MLRRALIRMTIRDPSKKASSLLKKVYRSWLRPYARTLVQYGGQVERSKKKAMATKERTMTRFMLPRFITE